MEENGIITMEEEKDLVTTEETPYVENVEIEQSNSGLDAVSVAIGAGAALGVVAIAKLVKKHKDKKAAEKVVDAKYTECEVYEEETEDETESTEDQSKK